MSGGNGPESTSRCFPPMTEKFYSDSPTLAGFAYSPRVLDAFRRSDRSGKAVFARLMAAHREGFQAEIIGVWDRADYYREETLRAIRSNPETAECWSAGAKALGLALDGPQFRRRFAREVALDSHAGLFLGQLTAGLKPEGRPRVHFETVARLQRELLLLTEEEERDLVDPMVAAARSQGQTDFLIEAAGLFPRQKLYANLALGQIYTSAGEQLQAADSAAKREAAIEKIIDRGEQLRRAAPWCAGCYQLIGMMEQERSILLANRRELRRSFEAIARAATYGGAAAVSGTKAQLDEIHAALKQNAAEIRRKLAATPNGRLTAQGAALVSMADHATRDADKWERSDLAKEIARLRDAAEAGPQRDLNGPREGVTPLVRAAVTEKVRGEEGFADWLGSAPGRRVRWQMALAASLAVFTLLLLGWQGLTGHMVSSARARVDKAVTAGIDGNTLDALSDFFTAPRPLRFDSASDLEFAELYRSTLARWAAERAASGGTISEEDRRRISRYQHLIENKGRLQEAAK
jgi:hypothetical protein